VNDYRQKAAQELVELLFTKQNINENEQKKR
jgi:hypothetical protein